MTGGVRVRPAVLVVNIWPESHHCCEAARWSLQVTRRADGQWAAGQGLGHGDKTVLTRSGQWTRDQRGNPDCRFTLREAIALARQHAATFTIAGRAAADVMRRHLQAGCPG